MFLKNSRYHGLPTHTAADAEGRKLSLVDWRRLPATEGEPATVTAHDQLDALAQTRYADATRYWHIADANTALQAAELTATPGAEILLPRS